MMHEFVLLDHDLIKSSEASLPVLASATLIGKSVFTTIAIRDRTPFLFEKHWRRLCANAASLGVDITTIAESDVRDSLQRIINENSVENGRARVTFFDMTATTLWPYDAKQPTRLLIATSDFRELPTEFRIGVSPYKIHSTSPLARIKSGNYLEKVLALEEARDRGFDECVQLNERDQVSSGCMANVFWVKDGSMFTPSLKTGCLAGTTREFVLENLECAEVEVGRNDMLSADDIFLMSAGLGVVQVAEFGGRKTKRRPHPIMDLVPMS